MPVNLYEKLTRGFPRLPRLVVISITPFAPLEPHTAVAAASLSTSIFAISSTFTERSEEYSSSDAFWKSKFWSGLSNILPSTTISGSALPLIVVTPRRRIDVPAPRLPEFATISSPAISPCKASSAEVNAIPSTSERLKVDCATVISFLAMLRPPDVPREPFTTISFRFVFSDSSFTSNVALSPIVTLYFLQPT